VISRPGFLDDQVAAELPGLHLAWTEAEFEPGPVPSSLRARLGELAIRYTGAVVIAMRTQQIPRAYRTLYRQMGLDPDATLPPAEEAALWRLRRGGFRADDLISAALLMAVVETGVPVWALARERVAPPLGITVGTVGEAVGSVAAPGKVHQTVAGGPRATDNATLVVADSGTSLCELFHDPPPGLAADPRAGTAVLYAIAAPGVPELYVEEALWQACEALGSAD
jgi:CubicO group peptidase (beta-lactamase class C family)